jgi:putative flavoprotein involved in K+ transport
MAHTDTIIIGAGQAGLATSYHLTQRGVDHVVLERGNIGQGWRDRWDSFCLVTPNWSVQLPGFSYDGDDPDGFMPRDDIVAYLERYAASFDAPVNPDTKITAVKGGTGEGFQVATNRGNWSSNNLVLATGAFQKLNKPAGADDFPANLYQIGLGDYTCAADLPDGDVLIIGSGQSGCQIAEELTEAGRHVTLACGRAPWMPRRIGEHDIFWWLVNSGFLDIPADTLPPEARLFANVLATGHGGGHDLNLRLLDKMGVTLVGRFVGVDGQTAQFADDLAASVAWGDEKYTQLCGMVTSAAQKLSLDAPDLPDPEPFEVTAPNSVDLSTFGAVLFTGGFRPDFSSWLPWTDAFDADGFPKQVNGSSTAVDGLYFVGIHFLRNRKSALLVGVGEDAGLIAGQISGR